MKNEPAFPAPNFAASTTHEGMTLRDYFAAKAVQGMLACPMRPAGTGADEFASAAYVMADAMLKAREAA